MEAAAKTLPTSEVEYVPQNDNQMSNRKARRVASLVLSQEDLVKFDRGIRGKSKALSRGMHNRRILSSVVKDGLRTEYHATKGARLYRD